jgi:hypothetical protein
MTPHQNSAELQFGLNGLICSLAILIWRTLTTTPAPVNVASRIHQHFRLVGAKRKDSRQGLQAITFREGDTKRTSRRLLTAAAILCNMESECPS